MAGHFITPIKYTQRTSVFPTSVNVSSYFTPHIENCRMYTPEHNSPVLVSRLFNRSQYGKWLFNFLPNLGPVQNYKYYLFIKNKHVTSPALSVNTKLCIGHKKFWNYRTFSWLYRTTRHLFVWAPHELHYTTYFIYWSSPSELDIGSWCQPPHHHHDPKTFQAGSLKQTHLVSKLILS